MEDGLYKFGYNGIKDVTKIVIYRLAPDTGLIWNSFEIKLSEDPFKNVYVLYSLSDTTGSTGSWTSKEGEVTDTITIYYYNKDNWDEVTIYTWKSDTEYAKAWPGEKMSAVEDHEGWYSKEIDSKMIFVIFSNNGLNQTADIQMDYDNTYYYQGAWQNSFKTIPTTEKVTIYYYNSNSWDNVYLYAWKDDINHNVDYPGEKMSAVSGHEGWYQALMDDTFTSVIFNNGDSNDNKKTSDIEIEARFRFKKRKMLQSIGLILGMFPGFMSMAAIYYIFKSIGMAGNVDIWKKLVALMLVYSGGAGLGYYVSKGFFDTVSRSLDEAARIDGAPNSVIFWKIILPLSKPIIVYTALMSFLGPWGDFIFASYLLGTQTESWTVAVGLFEILTNDPVNYYNMFMAGAVFVAVPITGLFLFLQRYFVEGITGGAVKG